jgi:cell shape-determining protein MreD
MLCQFRLQPIILVVVLKNLKTTISLALLICNYFCSLLQQNYRNNNLLQQKVVAITIVYYNEITVALSY